jgi:hypothetical protein
MPEEVFVLRMEAYPQPGSKDFGTEGGAMINCYVDAEDLRSAELRALESIRGEGWLPHRVDGWQLTCADCADDTEPDYGAPSSRSLVEQARVDGAVCVFHTLGPSMLPTNRPNQSLEPTAGRCEVHVLIL